MTAPATTRTLDRNLGVLRLIADGHLADMILQLPAGRQEAAAAAVVRLGAPAHGAAIVAATDADLPALVQRILTEEAVR